MQTEKPYHKSFLQLPASLNGRSDMYVVFIMLVILLGSTLLSGIFVNEFDERPSDTKYVPDLSKINNERYANLQLKTFPFKACGENVAINFLIDNSGSMEFGTKMTTLKSGLLTFADNFPGKGAIGMQAYSVDSFELVPFSLFRDSQGQFRQAVNSMRPLTATHSRSAFEFARQKMEAGMKKFPEHKFALIYISDGIPETSNTNDACPGGRNGRLCGPQRQNPLACRCYAESQDPTPVAQQLKRQGVRIFTIRYVDEARDGKYDRLLNAMMRRVASSPKDAYEAPFDNQISGIIDQITNSLCKEAS